MKKLIFIFSIVPILCQAQYFSGEIISEVTVIPKSDTVDLEEIIAQKHGTQTSYLITAKHYKSTYLKNGEYNYSYTYDDETKRMIDDYSDRPYMTFRDSRRANFEYFNSKIYKDSTIMVLGHECYMVFTKAEYGSSTIYYSDDIKVNYADFEGHKTGNWYNKLKEVDGALTMKSITEYDTYYEIREAIKIDARDVGINEFDLPAKPLAAAYTALDQQVDLKPPTTEQIQCYQEKVLAASNQEGEKFISYISFLLQKNGEIKFIEPVEKDDDGFYKIAIDVISNCGFQLIPGKIEGKHVDSQVYFPVEFLK